MPGIEKLTEHGPVGVLECCCTIAATPSGPLVLRQNPFDALPLAKEKLIAA
jgi:hypothetical protein